MVVLDLLLTRGSEGIHIGYGTPFGFYSLLTFKTFEELRNFAIGLLRWADTLDPPVPEVFIRAFEEKKKDVNG